LAVRAPGVMVSKQCDLHIVWVMAEETQVGLGVGGALDTFLFGGCKPCQFVPAQRVDGC
jgi:hypothetical protein